MSGFAFSPASLFASSEPGAWYDPSDLTTMFQDTAGTTPVTATGQTVGLLLDKSRGLVLGPELVTNGDFSSGTGWTLGTGWSISGGVASANIATGSTLAQAFTTTNGKTYAVTYTITSFTSGGVRARFTGTANVNGVIRSAAGTYTEYLTATATNGNFVMVDGGVGFVGAIDNITVKELAGNHATQATAASRPIYGIEPFGGRRNLLTFTEQFDNAAWVKTSQGSATVPTVTANAGTAPDGTTTAERVQFARTGTTTTDRSRIEQTAISVVASTNYTFSVWLKSFSGADQTVTIFPNYGNGSVVAATVTSEWQRFTVTANTLAGVTAAVVVGLGYATNSVTAADVLIWGAQFETGTTATAYQRVTDQWNVTQAGVASVSYLAFDGTDDFMLTGTITPGIDKAQVFAGVRKLAEAFGVIAETSTISSVTNGSLSIYTDATTFLSASSRGTAAQFVFKNGYAAPITAVMATLSDIAGDNATLRINGSQVAQNTGDQGTGNYLAYPLYIGRRGGTINPFNGRIYSLIVRFGANLAAGTITQAETWVNGKTGAY